MTYEEARNEMVLITDEHFSMHETIPMRPITYSRPEYYISVATGTFVLLGNKKSSWKKAVAETKKQLEEKGLLK